MTEVFALAASRSPTAIVSTVRGLINRGISIIPTEDLATFVKGWLELCEVSPLPDFSALEPPPAQDWIECLEALKLSDDEGPETRLQLSEYAIGLIHPNNDNSNPCGAEALFSLGYTDVFKQFLIYTVNYHDEVSRGECLDDDYRLRGLLKGFAGLLAQIGHARDLFELTDWISERRFPRVLHYRDRFERHDGSYHDFIREFSILDTIGENLERIRNSGKDEDFSYEVEHAIVSPHPANRAIAISGLPSPEIVGRKKLRAMLKDPSRQVRLRVLDLLRQPVWACLSDTALDVVTDPIATVRKLAANIIERYPQPRMLEVILENLDFQVRQAHRNPGHDSLYKGNIRCIVSQDERALQAMVAAAMSIIHSLEKREDFTPIFMWLQENNPKPITYPESVQFFFLGEDQMGVERFFNPEKEVLDRLSCCLANIDQTPSSPAPKESLIEWGLRIVKLLPN